MPALTPDSPLFNKRVTATVPNTMMPLFVGALSELCRVEAWEKYGALSEGDSEQLFNAILSSLVEEDLMPLAANYVEFTETAQIAGWSSFNIKHITGYQIGRLAIVQFRLAGISDGNWPYIQVPFEIDPSGATGVVPMPGFCVFPSYSGPCQFAWDDDDFFGFWELPVMGLEEGDGVAVWGTLAYLTGAEAV